MSWVKFSLGSALLLLVLLSITYPISGLNDFPQVVVAWGTVMLASVTFLLIRNNREQEKRDRKERLFNEVTIWLKDLESHIFPSSDKKLGKEILEEINAKSKSLLPEGTWNLIEDLDKSLIQLSNLGSGIKEAEYYQKLTLKINEELSKIIEIISKHLKQRIQLVSDSFHPRATLSRKEINEMIQKESELIDELIKDDNKPLDGCGLSEEGLTRVQLARNAGTIRKSINNAIDEVIELKMKLLK